MNKQNKILYLSGINNNNKYGYYNAVYSRQKVLKKKSKLPIDFVSIPIVDTFLFSIIKKTLMKNPNLPIKKEESITQYFPYKKTICSLIINFFKKDYIEKKMYEILKELHKKNNYNFIHAHWIYPYGYLAYKLSLEYNIPYVVNMHGSDIHTHPYRNSNIMIKTILTLNKSNSVFSVSQELLDEVKKFNKIEQHSFIVTFNGVFLPSLENIVMYYKKKHIAFIGILSQQKGADYLIPIYRKLKFLGLELEMTIIGDGELYYNIKKSIEKYNLNINLLGYCSSEEIKKLKKNFDLIIVPSRVEGFGMVVLEGYAFNIPVISTNAGGLKGLVLDKSNLINLRDGNIIENFTKKIIYFYNTEQTYSLKYYDYAKKYNWEEIVKIEGEEYL